MSRPHADGGGCYVFGRTEVREGMAPVCDEPGCNKLIADFWTPPAEMNESKVKVDMSKCKYCGFELNHDEGWCDRLCDTCRDEEELERADYEERDYDPDEDRAP